MAEHFAFPGQLQDAPAMAEKWSSAVAAFIDVQVADCPQFFDPRDVDETVAIKEMVWGAFPRKLARLTGRQRLVEGEDRAQQEEYCEWAGIRNEAGKLVRASFTTETLFYYDFLATDADALVEIYRNETGEAVEAADLFDAQKHYDPLNRWNLSHAIHMIQGSNTLTAAAILAAQASVVRTDERDQVITNTGRLIECGISADVDRNSDPLIVTDVNELARRGARISLQQPLGLYIDGLQTEGWTTPDGSDPRDYWTLSRGKAGQEMRATFATPPGSDFEIGDIKINGSPITSPSQIAEHLTIRLTGVATTGNEAPVLTRCGERPAGLESLDEGLQFPTRTAH